MIRSTLEVRHRSFTHKQRPPRGAVRYHVMLSHIRRSSLLCTMLIIGAVAVPASGHSQPVLLTGQTLTDTAGRTTAPLAADAGVGPRIVQAGVLTREQAPAALVPLQPRDRIGAGSNLALMGVGVTALILGLVIGDDVGTVIAISGGAIGLDGLYRYLR